MNPMAGFEKRMALVKRVWWWPLNLLLGAGIYFIFSSDYLDFRSNNPLVQLLYWLMVVAIVFSIIPPMAKFIVPDKKNKR